MLNRKSMVAVFAATALGAGFVAGCGSSNDTSSASTSSSTAATDTSASTPAAPALTGDPLRIGLMCACTGPVAGTTGGTPKLVAAWEKSTNASGGINGHPVKVTLVDDKNDPATSTKVVRQLVDQDKVQGIVSASFQESAWTKISDKAGVPVTGGNSANPEFAADPLLFPSSTNFPALYYGMANELKKAGKTKVAVMACAELPVCAGVPLLFDAIGQGVVGGVKVVNKGKIPATAPNYTAQCLAAKNSGADAALYAHSSDVTVRVAESCVQQGFKPQLVNYASTVSSNWLKSDAFNGVITAQPNVPLSDDTTPGMKKFNAAMDKYAADLKSSSQYGVITLNIWAGLELFKAAAEKAKMDGASTPADLQTGLYGLKDETMGGIAPPLNFTKGKPAFIPCYFVMGIEKGAYTAPQGVKPVCMPPAKIPVLGKVLAAAAG